MDVTKADTDITTWSPDLDEPVVEQAPPARSARAPRARLAGLSMLMLFVELALIRWTAANNIHLAYVTNFVLLASFLGIGLGFLLGGSPRQVWRWAPPALAVLVAFVLAFPVKLVALAGPHQLAGGFGRAPLPQWVSLPVIFVLTVVVMACIAQAVARAFGQFPPLEAYRLDIAGSIAGIAAFSALSFLRLPPVAWGLVAAVGIAVLMGPRLRWWQWAALAVTVGLLLAESLSPNDYWSPYYKVTAVQPPGQPGTLVVSANNIPHQTAYPISTLRRIERFYFFPYRHVSALNNVLVIGAGTGNDVAVALSEGAKHVDAVEIDPVLAGLGRRYHANRPYQDPRVTVHINDGRAYLQQTHQPYDLILLALPDSLTVLAGQSSLRLENFLLTEDSIRSARAHLTTSGTFAMANYYEPFLLDRYASMVDTAFGARPCVEVGDPLGGRRQAVITDRAGGQVPGCHSIWAGKTMSPSTDDWPFPYLKSPTVPSIYLWMLGLIIGGSLLLVRGVGGPLRRMTRYTDLALMGGAFMLLETKNVVQFALFFGTTWFVNSLVFAGVLLSVYAAVEVARRFVLPRPAVLYGLLLAALATAWAVPQEWLLALPFALRFVTAVAVAFSPIFLANLVFAQRFRQSASSTVAFGANLLGAIAGGVLEYLSLLTGYRFLLVVVGALYALAYVAGRRHLGRAPGPVGGPGALVRST
ncbi:MAG TPA: hypothetical protein VFA11_12560 [Acidimicrobiales bacterium]|nr:hypothetical protein [Acidimicrobiales bacterium]